MVLIGIISPLHKDNIRRCLKRILINCTAVSKKTDCDTLYALEMSSVDFCVIDLEKNSCYVDILILDTDNKTLISKALRSISPDTRLVYNFDCFPQIVHPYAVSYGFSENATATVSSVDETAMILYLHPIIRLDNSISDEGEYRVQCCETNVSDILCAVACGMLCGTVGNGRPINF